MSYVRVRGRELAGAPVGLKRLEIRLARARWGSAELLTAMLSRLQMKVMRVDFFMVSRGRLLEMCVCRLIRGAVLETGEEQIHLEVCFR